MAMVIIYEHINMQVPKLSLHGMLKPGKSPNPTADFT